MKTRLYIILMIVVGAVIFLIPEYLLWSHIPRWVVGLQMVTSIPFLVLNIWWLIFPERYVTDCVRLTHWWVEKLERLVA